MPYNQLTQLSLRKKTLKSAITLVVCMLCGCGIFASAQQCSFTSTSNGSDGAYDLTATPAGTTVYFKASNFKGSGVANNVFNFTKINIPVNVTVKFTENVFHGPVYWLASSDVTIAGTLDLSGANAVNAGADPTTRQPPAAGSGGYPGGVGGGGVSGFITTAGGGPGGGAAGKIEGPGGGAGTDGTFVGSNDYLVPLVGGSGGGGQDTGPAGGTNFGSGGGAGGGAILIASTTTITVSGAITVQGGSAGNCGGSGSGGGVLLKANALTGGGSITVSGGSASCAAPPYYNFQQPGLARLETCNYNFNGPVYGAQQLVSTPVKLFLPNAPLPSIQVTSVNGIAITENPFSFPDITINTASPVPVVITAHEVPLGTVPTLYVFSENGDKQLQCGSAGLQGTTLATSTCTINITFPFGGSRGFVKANWTAQ